MAPLRLQIAVQPRPLPSPSKTVSSGPTIKWLEICHGDPTIQELSEILELRFYQRNHEPLNIKILKFLDDVELYPSYKVREIFEDIKDAQDPSRSLSTVKVYRNPPTDAELTQPSRFESLPPESLARPRKRPLPPLFAETVRNDSRDTPYQSASNLRRSPAPSLETNKRQKMHAFGVQHYADSDRLFSSLEDPDDGHGPSCTAGRRPSLVREVEDSQKSSHKKRTDPYGTPVSSRSGLQERGKSRVDDVISVRDSPEDHMFDYSNESLPNSRRSLKTGSNSPEIPQSLSPSLQSQEAPTEAGPTTDVPPISQLPEVLDATNVAPLVPRTEAPIVALPTSLHLQNRSPLAQPAADVPKPTSPNTRLDPEKPGRLPRPKSLKRTPAAKSQRKIINGVKQTTPSVFEPIDTSEGSSHERELLRSAKRLRATATPRKIAQTPAAQKNPGSASAGGPFVIPEVPPCASAAATVPEAAREGTLSHSQETSTDALQEAPVRRAADDEIKVGAVEVPCSMEATHTLEESLESRNEGITSSQQAASPPHTSKPTAEPAPPERARQDAEDIPVAQLGRPHKPFHVNESLVIMGVEDVANDEENEEYKRLLEEAETAKRDAQASFDRIAAKAAARKERLRKEQEERIGREQEAKTRREQEEKIRQEQEEKMRQERERRIPQEHVEKEKEGNSILSDVASAGGTKTAEPRAPSDSPREEAQHPAEDFDIEAERRYALEYLVPIRNQFLIPFEGPKVRKPRKQRAGNRRKDTEAQLVSRRETRLTCEQTAKNERIVAEKRQEEDRQAKEQTVQNGKGKAEQDRRAEEGKRKEKKKTEEQEAKIEQERLAKEIGAREAKLKNDERAKESRTARRIEVQGQEVSKESIQKAERQEGVSRRNADKTPSQAEVHVNAGGNGLGHTTSAESRLKGQSLGEDGKTMSEQQVNGSGQSGLVERSPKARFNAERQLQLANQFLKSTKGDSAVVKALQPARTSKSVDKKAAMPKPLQKAHRQVANPSTKMHHDVQTSEQPAKAVHHHYTDSDALRAAGIYCGDPSASTARKAAPPSILKPTAPIDLTESSQPSQRDSLVRNAPEREPSAPPEDIRTMTPAVPSSSMKSDPDSAEVKAVSAQRAASVASNRSKTPMRSAMRMTPCNLLRSVSFADEHTSSSQPAFTDTASAVQASTSTNGGMFQRALEESNAKRAETALKSSQSASSAPSLSINKVQRAPPKKKQTKMTQHIYRDQKLKGKAIDRPSPSRAQEEDSILLSSLSEASTFFSDDSERTRNARAGPSSRKKVRARTHLEGAAGSARAASSQNPERLVNRFGSVGSSLTSSNAILHESAKASMIGNHPAIRESGRSRSPAMYGSNAVSKGSLSANHSGPVSVKSSKTTRSSSTSSSESGSDSESSSESYDSLSLLPRSNGSQQRALDPIRRSSQQTATTRKTPSQSSQKPLPSQEPRTPNNQTETAKATQLEDEKRTQSMASQQLQREHEEAMQLSTMKPPSTKGNSGKEQSGEIPVSVPQDPKGRRVANAGFDRTSLTTLRKAQAAQPMVLQRASSSDLDFRKLAPVPEKQAVPSGTGSEDSDSSSSDSDDVLDPARIQAKLQKTPASRPKGFKKVIKELWGWSQDN
ncbi:MAG: hypothetical protein Q9201_001165 [Fulgogasparrea decipioides]